MRLRGSIGSSGPSDTPPSVRSSWSSCATNRVREPSGLHSAPAALPTALLVSRTAFCWFLVTAAARLDLARGSPLLGDAIRLILLAKACLQLLSRLLCWVRHLPLRSPEQTGWMPSSLKGASVGQSAKRHSTAVSQVHFGWFAAYRFSLAPNTVFLNHSGAGVRRVYPKWTAELMWSTGR